MDELVTLHAQPEQSSSVIHSVKPAFCFEKTEASSVKMADIQNTQKDGINAGSYVSLASNHSKWLYQHHS